MDGEKILIAEAEQKITELASFKLSNAGYLIFTVSGGESVLETAADIHPDLFLIGNNLPIKPGLEVCSGLRMDPLFTATPIILIVDSEFDETQLKNCHFKIDNILVKPFTPKNLLQKVNESMTQYRLIKQVNPKTLLPGKVHLMNKVNSLIDEGSGFELVFCDLKNFGICELSSLINSCTIYNSLLLSLFRRESDLYATKAKRY
jgi:DNA-binding response OmpR family regulator